MSISFNGATRVMTLSSGTTSLDVADLYSRWKDWVALDDNSKWPEAFLPVGGDDIDPISGTRIPLYAFLQNSWRVRPQEAHHTLNVIGGVLLVAGGGAPFLATVGAYTVQINYQQPVQAITVLTGGSPAPTASEVAEAVWNHPDAVEIGMTPIEALRLVAAMAAGDLEIAGAEVTIKAAVVGGKTRLVATVTPTGVRTLTVRDATP